MEAFPESEFNAEIPQVINKPSELFNLALKLLKWLFISHLLLSVSSYNSGILWVFFLTNLHTILIFIFSQVKRG